MKFEDIKLILEKREYKHREDYNGNKKGSYIEKGKTKWDYSSEDAKPGNERIVTQIQNKVKKISGKSVSREKVKDLLKKSEGVFKSFEKKANKKFGSDKENPDWRRYVFGAFTFAMARSLIK